MKGTKTFEIILNQEFATEGYTPAYKKSPIYEISSGIKHKYSKWYHKILYYLTFKQRFVEGYEYRIKPIND